MQQLWKNSYSAIELFTDVYTILLVIFRAKATAIQQRALLPLKLSWSPNVKATWGDTIISLLIKLNQFALERFWFGANIFSAKAFFDWIYYVKQRQKCLMLLPNLGSTNRVIVRIVEAVTAPNFHGRRSKLHYITRQARIIHQNWYTP